MAACLGVVTLLLSGAAGADSDATPPERPCPERVALRVQRHYESVRALEAGFVQQTRSVMLGSSLGGDERTEGRVVFAKPGRMRWEYEKPEPSLVVSDGETLWIHDPAAREVQRLPVSQGYLSGAALQFLLGEGDVLESFAVDADACGDDAESVELRLTPRSGATYERLGLTVSPSSGEVQATEVIDLFGNATRIAFRDVKTNPEVPDATFRFTPPDGTRVIDLSPAR